MDKVVREVIYSPEYEAYYAGLDSKTKEKYDYVEHIIKTQDVVKKNYVKHLENTDLATEAHDDTTISLINDFLVGQEKTVWMLVAVSSQNCAE